ncbi:MAG: DUF721 domain-containing protein [Bacteroidota bacterium]
MNPVHLGRILDDLARRGGLAPRLRAGMAVEYWPRVVGPQVAGRTEAGPVRNRVLFVRTPDPGLAHQLSLMEREILKRYARLLGGPYLSGVRPQIGEISLPAGKDPPAEDKPLEISENQARKFASLAEEIKDPEIAAAFLRAARAWAVNTGVRDAKEAEENYLRLMTSQNWPTPGEIAAALEAVAPERRASLRETAAGLIRREISGQVGTGDGQPFDSLRFHGAIRRLALALWDRADPVVSAQIAKENGLRWRDAERQE